MGTAGSRNSVNYQSFLELIGQANPVGYIDVITDNLSNHNRKPTREWLADHPRIKHAFIPIGACWLNLQEPWWWILRRDAFTSQTTENHTKIDQATRQATAALNARARPWFRDRPAPKPRTLRRRFIDHL
ncbi:hypothetical protein ACFZC5_35985 [Nocardia gamkensis]|uniref:hypothetical protein n=1 Tax=Nocardia gamkensis TaxID=352869 RepID=UPI0036E23AFE